MTIPNRPQIQSGHALGIEAEVVRALRIRDNKGEPSKQPDASVTEHEGVAQIHEHTPETQEGVSRADPCNISSLRQC